MHSNTNGIEYSIENLKISTKADVWRVSCSPLEGYDRSCKKAVKLCRYTAPQGFYKILDSLSKSESYRFPYGKMNVVAFPSSSQKLYPVQPKSIPIYLSALAGWVTTSSFSMEGRAGFFATNSQRGAQTSNSQSLRRAPLFPENITGCMGKHWVQRDDWNELCAQWTEPNQNLMVICNFHFRNCHTKSHSEGFVGRIFHVHT